MITVVRTSTGWRALFEWICRLLWVFTCACFGVACCWHSLQSWLEGFYCEFPGLVFLLIRLTVQFPFVAFWYYVTSDRARSRWHIGKKTNCVVTYMSTYFFLRYFVLVDISLLRWNKSVGPSCSSSVDKIRINWQKIDRYRIPSKGSGNFDERGTNFVFGAWYFLYIIKVDQAGCALNDWNCWSCCFLCFCCLLLASFASNVICLLVVFVSEVPVWLVDLLHSCWSTS